MKLIELKFKNKQVLMVTVLIHQIHNLIKYQFLWFFKDLSSQQESFFFLFKTLIYWDVTKQNTGYVKMKDPII